MKPVNSALSAAGLTVVKTAGATTGSRASRRDRRGHGTPSESGGYGQTVDKPVPPRRSRAGWHDTIEPIPGFFNGLRPAGGRERAGPADRVRGPGNVASGRTGQPTNTPPENPG